MARHRKNNWATVGMTSHVREDVVVVFVRMTAKSALHDPKVPDEDSLRRIFRDIERVILTIKIGLDEDPVVLLGEGPFVTHDRWEVSSNIFLDMVNQDKPSNHNMTAIRAAVRSACALLRSNHYSVKLVMPPAKQGVLGEAEAAAEKAAAEAEKAVPEAEPEPETASAEADPQPVVPEPEPAPAQEEA